MFPGVPGDQTQQETYLCTAFCRIKLVIFGRWMLDVVTLFSILTLNLRYWQSSFGQREKQSLFTWLYRILMWATTSGWEQACTSRKPKTLSRNTHESRGKSAWRRRSLLVCHISEETGSICGKWGSLWHLVDARNKFPDVTGHYNFHPNESWTSEQQVVAAGDAVCSTNMLMVPGSGS